MSARSKMMFEMRCDFPGCPAELESYDGGAWLYDTEKEARDAAYDHDWAVNADTGRDYCDRHRDEADVEVGGQSND